MKTVTNVPESKQHTKNRLNTFMKGMLAIFNFYPPKPLASQQLDWRRRQKIFIRTASITDEAKKCAITFPNKKYSDMIGWIGRVVEKVLLMKL